MHVGARYFRVINKPGFPIHADMRFIAEVPRVALFRLVRIRVAFLLSVLRRGCGGDDGRVYNGTLLENQTLYRKEANHLREQLLLKAVLHQRHPKQPDGIAVRYLVAGIDTTELRKGTVVDDLRHRAHV